MADNSCDPQKMVDNSTEVLNDDEYTKAIGECGRWQIFIFLALAIPIKVVAPGIYFGIVFLAPKTTFNCIERSNSIEEMLNGTCYSDCVKYEYFSDFDDSIITQWDLVCDRAWLANLTQTACMFGILVGNIFFGFISDRYGRRPTLLLAGLLETCSAFAMPFCSNYWAYVVMRFFIGAGTGGTMITAFILLMEIFGPNKREFLGCIYGFPLVAGHFLTTIIALFFKNWGDISLVSAVPTLMYLTFALYIPESPKWLISVGRFEEASAVMINAAKWNKLPTDNMLAIVEKISKKGITNKNESKATFLHLITLSSLRMKNLCSCLIWFIHGLSFHGATQYFGQTSSNVFLMFALMGLAMFPAIVLSAIMSKIVGRRWTLITFLLISSIGTGLTFLSDDWYHVKLIAGSIGLGSGGAVTSLLYVYTPELFPTVARNMAVGASSTINRIGSMLAPFIGGMHASAAWIPASAIVVTPLAAVVAIYFLPDMKGKQLKDHLEEN